MSRKANTTIIGAFVLGAAVLAVAGIVIFGGGRFFKTTMKHALFFEGSVKGLAVGAPVSFKGVRVGSVTDINLLFDPADSSFKIMVLIETEPDRITPIRDLRESPAGNKNNYPDRKDLVELLIQKGLRAKLGMQSLVTGLLYVNLDFYPDTPARIVGIDKRYEELPTIPSSLEQLSKTVERLPLEEIADKFVASLEGIERFINSPDSQQILASINTAAKDAQALLQNISSRVEPIAGNLNQTMTDTRKLVNHLDSQVGPMATDVRETVREARNLIKNMDKNLATVSTGVDGTLKSAQLAVKQAEMVLVAVEGAVGQDSDVRYELVSALKEFSHAAKSMRVLSDYLERNPDALLRGKTK